MGKYLSKIQPIVCLNSIKSIYQKQSESKEQLTRKRILVKYLHRLMDQKLKEYLQGEDIGEPVLDPELRE